MQTTNDLAAKVAQCERPVDIHGYFILRAGALLVRVRASHSHIVILRIMMDSVLKMMDFILNNDEFDNKTGGFYTKRDEFSHKYGAQRRSA